MFVCLSDRIDLPDAAVNTQIVRASVALNMLLFQSQRSHHIYQPHSPSSEHSVEQESYAAASMLNSSTGAIDRAVQDRFRAFIGYLRDSWQTTVRFTLTLPDIGGCSDSCIRSNGAQLTRFDCDLVDVVDKLSEQAKRALFALALNTDDLSVARRILTIIKTVVETGPVSERPQRQTALDRLGACVPAIALVTRPQTQLMALQTLRALLQGVTLMSSGLSLRLSVTALPHAAAAVGASMY